MITIFIQHEQPQNSRSNLLATTKNNYSVAESFFRQRTAIFNNILKQRMKMNVEEFQNSLNDNENGMLKAWTQFCEECVKAAGTKPSSGKIFSVHGTEILSFSKEEMAEFLSGTSKDVKRRLAYKFEDVFQTYLDKQGGTNFVEQKIGELISASAIMPTAKMIRPDAVFSSDGITIKQIQITEDRKNQTYAVYENNNNEQNYIELQTLIDLDNFDIKDINQEPELSKYLLESNFLAGFSLKNYSDSIKYSGSTFLKSELNSIYNTKHPWEPDYAIIYMRYFLSKYLINIISPTVIALAEQNVLMWSYEILANKLFVFHVNAVKGAPGRGERAWFKVNNSNIFLTQGLRAGYRKKFGKNKDKFITIKIDS